MAVRFAILFAAWLLHAPTPIQAPKSAGNSGTSSYSILPLIMVKSESDELKIPESLPNFMTFRKPDGNFLGGTRFYANTPLQTIFFCPRDESENTEGPSHTEDSRILVPRKFEEKEILTCEKEPNPMVRKITEETSNQEISCGAENAGIFYKFIYQLRPAETETERNRSPTQEKLSFSNRELEIYRFCYDHHNKKTLYTEYQLRSPLLLDKSSLENEREHPYEKSTEGYEYFDSTFQTTQSLFQRLKKTIIPKSNEEGFEWFPYEPEPITEPNHMAFALWRKPTFHYSNFSLLHRDLKPIWNDINQRIRRKAAEKYYYTFRAYTGAFKISNDESLQLTALNDEIQVPQIWVKIIITPDDSKDLTRGYNGLAIMVNNHFDEEMMNNLFDNYCKGNLCADMFDNEFKNTKKYVRCCPVTTKIQKLFNLNILIVHQPLSILEHPYAVINRMKIR